MRFSHPDELRPVHRTDAVLVRYALISITRTVVLSEGEGGTIPFTLLSRKTPVAGFTFIDLFAGIGGTRLGFEAVGGRCEFSSERDPYAQRTYQSNHGDLPHGDITAIDLGEIPEHDVLVAGFPCQPFSIAGVSKLNALGRQNGFAHPDQGNLFYSVRDVLKVRRPRAFLLENVKNLERHNRGETFRVIKNVLERELHYHVKAKVINARLVVPQHRERIYIVGFRDREDAERFAYPEIRDRAARVKDILDSTVDARYTLSDHLWTYLQDYAKRHRARGNGFGFGLAAPDGVTRTLSARYYKDGSEILIEQGGKLSPRRLTPRECARLMGFPQKFRIVVSDTRAYQQFGNSVVVPVVEAVARQMIRAMQLPKTSPGRYLRDWEPRGTAELSAPVRRHLTSHRLTVPPTVIAAHAPA